MGETHILIRFYGFISHGNGNLLRFVKIWNFEGFEHTKPPPRHATAYTHTDAAAILPCKLHTAKLHCYVTYSFTHSLTLNQSLTHPFTHSPIHPLTHSLNHLITHPPTHTLTQSTTHSPTHSLTRTLNHSLAHSITHSLHTAQSFLRS
jgi:hypothetical protein